jgi:hypothetical protein
MKYKVQMYQGGKTYIEEVYANSPKEAREVAQNLNKYAKVVSVNVTFL